MKKIYKNKRMEQKVVQSICFDSVVLHRLEEVANKENTTLSKLVNMLCYRIIMTDELFYLEMARFHASKLAEYQYLRDNAHKINEV